MHVIVAFLIFLGFIISQVPDKNIKKTDETVNLKIEGAGGPVTIRENVIPLDEIQSRATVKQTYDYSCGSAALATLLNGQFNEDFSEKQIITGLMQYGDRSKIAQRRAFSLLDMKRFVQKLGYKGVGYTATIEDLRSLDQPGIVPIEIFEYLHFTVFRGIYKNHVFLADPWRGNISFSIKEFEKKWHKNVIFIVSIDSIKGFFGLRLTDEDLRFVDEDFTRKFIYDPTRDIGPPTDRKVDNVPGEYQIFKR